MKYNSPLLIPVPNKENKVGENREKYIIKPSSNSTQLLAMYEYLGILFGCCIRTGVRLPLDLPSFVWKPLVYEELTFSDLDAIDRSTATSLQFIRRCDRATFDQSVTEAFTCALSDKTLVELKETGALIPVTYDTREEYVRLVLNARLTEHSAQIDAIRRGLGRIMPTQLLNLLTWRELEVMVCGEPFIDVDLLRRHTEYSAVSPDAKHIDIFWSVLENFDQKDRRRFIQFAWAQERLPSDDQEFVKSHTRMMIKPSAFQPVDKALPRADTCFFNVELPAYTSSDIMRKQLLFALSTAISMDKDEEPEPNR